MKWDDNDVWTQAKIIAYSQLRQHEELESERALLGSGSHPNLKPAKIRGRRRRR